MQQQLISGRVLTLSITLLVTAAAEGIQRQQSESIATEKIFAALQIREGSTVCEIGAGDGDLSIAAAKVVGVAGRVFTTELGDNRVKTLREKVAASGHSHITVLAGDPKKSNIPDGTCDGLFMRNVYHHFEDPAAMNSSIAAAVKPGGRVAVVDFSPPGKEAERPADRDNDGMHGISAESLSRELKEAGFQPVSSETGSERWFMIVVEKR